MQDANTFTAKAKTTLKLKKHSTIVVSKNKNYLCV